MAAAAVDVPEQAPVRNATSLIQSVWSRDPKEIPFNRSASFGLFTGIRIFGDDLPTNSSERATEIRYAVDDAVDLATMFVRELELIDCTRVKLLLSGRPIKASSAGDLEWLLRHGAILEAPRYTAVYRALKDLATAQISGEGGLLVVSFATHGVYLDSGGDSLLCSDSSSQLLKQTTVPLQYVISQIAGARAARRLALIDSCRKRAFAEKERSTEEEALEARSRFERLSKALSAASGTAVLSATSIGGVSFDDDQTQNGVFTGQLIAGLRGKAQADARGYITVRNLAAWTNDAVKQWIGQNQPGHFHDSAGIGKEFFGDNPEEIPLALSAAVVREVASKRRDGLIARLAVLRSRDPEPARSAYRDVMRALDESPPQPAEKISMDKLEQQLRLVETAGFDAAENFVLWWQQKGSLLLPPAPVVEGPAKPEKIVDDFKIKPTPPNKVWALLGAACLIVIVGVILLTIHHDDPVALPDLWSSPVDLQSAVPQKLALHIESHPTGASVHIAGANQAYSCNATPCDIRIDDPGPFVVTIAERFRETWRQKAETRESLAQMLGSPIELEQEKPK